MEGSIITFIHYHGTIIWFITLTQMLWLITTTAHCYGSLLLRLIIMVTFGSSLAQRMQLTQFRRSDWALLFYYFKCRYVTQRQQKEVQVNNYSLLWFITMVHHYGSLLLWLITMAQQHGYFWIGFLQQLQVSLSSQFDWALFLVLEVPLRNTSTQQKEVCITFIHY